MKYFYYNSTLVIFLLLTFVLTLLKLNGINHLDFILLPVVLIATISLILKIFRGIKINQS